ncbi:hypothetical protein [Holdemania massiliensis]|uniref:hypothetical protein n=1 Tax=Holdemania massiliensis TaxID=1468449 RepID=UPI001F05D00E|nr:hypothetical protein [Holdemania massiliensis]MCH1939360.1 hypothetical protein [Holdemania massiliensis]
MKKNIGILSFLMIIIAFWFTYPLFNQLSEFRFLEYERYYDSENCEKAGLTIENNQYLIELDSREYFQTINELAVSNHLVVSLRNAEVDEGGIHIESFYLSSNAKDTQKAFLLEKGQVDVTSADHEYSSFAQQKDRRVAFIFSDAGYRVTSILNSINKAGFYSLYNLEGDGETHFNNFINQLTDKYPGMNIIRQPNPIFAEKLSDFAYIDNPFEDLQIKFFVIFIITLILGSKIFSLQKKISLYKMEGYSSFRIYCMMVLKDFFISIIIFFLLFSLMLFGYYGGSINTYTAFMMLYGIELFQLVIIECFVSLIFYGIIAGVPITSSSKGKNKLKEVQFAAYIIKAVTVTIMLPIMISTYGYVKDFVIMNVRHDHAAKSLNNYYIFANSLNSIAYNLDMASANYISLRDDFIWNNGLFDMGKGILIDDYASFDPNQLDEIIVVDESYLRQTGLWDETMNPQEIYIFLKEGIEIDREKLQGQILSGLLSPLPVHWIDLKVKLQSYIPSGLLFSDEIEDLPVVYMPEEPGYEGQLNYRIIYYDGSVSEAQEYVDSLFWQHGYTPAYKMEPLREAFERTFRNYNANNVDHLVQFTVLLLAYILANQFLLEVDIDNNRKRYFLAATEGMRPYSAQKYILKFASASMLAVVVCLVLKQITIGKTLFYAIVSLGSAEVGMYLIYLIQCNRIRR